MDGSDWIICSIHFCVLRSAIEAWNGPMGGKYERARRPLGARVMAWAGRGSPDQATRRDRFYIEQAGVNSIRSGWDPMRLHLKQPAKWGPKLLRHSIATLLCDRRVDP
jgi:hypothetical protein